jgi:hypothetical protein
MKAWVRLLGHFVGEFRRNAANEITRQLVSAGELAMVRESQTTQTTLQVRESDYSDLQYVEVLEQRSDDQTRELQARMIYVTSIFAA